MAFLQLSTLPATCTITRLPSASGSGTLIGYNYPSRSNRFFACPVRCSVPSEITGDQTVMRRSEITFHNSFDKYDLVESLTSKFEGEACIEQAQKLKERVKTMLETTSRPLDQLELIDDVERLGVGYHFQMEIKRILDNIFCDRHTKGDIEPKHTDLYAAALEYRLLRNHGLGSVSKIILVRIERNGLGPREEDLRFDGFILWCYWVDDAIFKCFKNDEEGSFKLHLGDDLKGMLYLYEASYYSEEGETLMDETRDFTTKYLQKHAKVHHNSTEYYLSKLVNHALETPLAWRPTRMECSWFIYAYQSKDDKDPILLEFAKLDFNMCQAKYLEELKHAIRWWKSTRLAEKLSFQRDWIGEIFLYATAVAFEPQFENGRRMITKTAQFINKIDDIYDVYGTLDELELFTDIVARWDANVMDQLPDYMKLFFLPLFNTINELAYDVLRDHGFHILPYLKRVLADICKAYLVEAKWFHDGYTPTLQEYLDNATITIAAEAVVAYAYFYIENPITNEALQCLQQRPDMCRWLAMILRLANDLGTSVGELKRGDVPKSVECYMHETGASEDEARKYIRNLLLEAWKKVEKVRSSSPLFSQTFFEVVVNVGRVALTMYPNGEEYDHALKIMRDSAISIFMQPVT